MSIRPPRPHTTGARTLVATLLLTLAALAVVFTHSGADPAAAGERLTYDDLVALLEVDTDEDELIRLIEDADELLVESSQFGGLRSAGASEAVIAAVRQRLNLGVRVSLEGIIRMVDQGMEDQAIINRVLAAGAHFDLTARDKLRLTRAGVSAEVIAALEGRYVLPGHKSHTARNRTFSAQYPEAWNVHELHTDEGLVQIYSPKDDVAARDDFSLGMQVQVSVLPADSPFTRTDVISAHEEALPALLRRNRTIHLRTVPGARGMVRGTNVAGVPAVRRRLAAEMDGEDVHEILVQTVVGNIYYFVEFIAPVDQFERWEPRFERMLQAFRPMPAGAAVTRRADPFDPRTITDRYGGSIFRVETSGGWGTGFAVREDGWVLTNHHVVCTLPTHETCTADPMATVVGEVTLHRDGDDRTWQATVIDSDYTEVPSVDLALLHVTEPMPNLRPLPLSPVGLDRTTGWVRQGDRVSALGYPGLAGGESLTQTAGVLAKISITGESEAGLGGDHAAVLGHMLTDALIHQGSSGGPCVSLETGGVIGLNTFSPLKWATGPDGARVTVDSGYGGVVPIDRALESFPQLILFPMGRDPEPIERVEIARMLLDNGRVDAAVRELEAAAGGFDDVGEADPLNAARYHYARALVLERRAEWTDARLSLENALAFNPNHVGALSLLPTYFGEAELLRGLALLDRAVRLNPDDWSLHEVRGDLLQVNGRNEEAIEAYRTVLEESPLPDAEVHVKIGDCLYRMARHDEALDAYREALDIEPGHLQAALGVIDHHVAVGDREAAARVFEDLERRIGHSNTRIGAMYGVFQMDSADLDTFLEGLMRVVNAERTDLERGIAVDAGLLQQTCEAALAREGARDAGLLAAYLLYLGGDDFKGIAHHYAARLWDAQGRGALARAHYRAAQSAGAATLPEEHQAPEFLSMDDVDSLLHGTEEKWEPWQVQSTSMFGDVVNHAPIGFGPNDLLPLRVRERVWGREHWQWVTSSMSYDIRTGTADLADALSFEWVPQSLLEDEEGIYATLTITNNAPVDLAGIVMRVWYKDEDGEVLAQQDRWMNLGRRCLLAGETVTERIVLGAWTDEALNGLTQWDVAKASMEIVQARQNPWTSLLSLDFGYVDEDPDLPEEALYVDITNLSSATLSAVTVTVHWTDNDGQPIARDDGLTCADTRSWSVNIEPGRTTRITCEDWDRWEYLYDSVGVPRNWGERGVFANVRITDADYTLPEPESD